MTIGQPILACTMKWLPNEDVNTLGSTLNFSLVPLSQKFIGGSKTRYILLTFWAITTPLQLVHKNINLNKQCVEVSAIMI